MLQSQTWDSVSTDTKVSMGHYFVELKQEFERVKGPYFRGRKVRCLHFGIEKMRQLEVALNKDPRQF